MAARVWENAPPDAQKLLLNRVFRILFSEILALKVYAFTTLKKRPNLISFVAQELFKTLSQNETPSPVLP